MKKISIVLLLSCYLFSLMQPIQAQNQPSKTGDVLLIYDDSELLEVTENILTAFNKKVDTLQVDEYQKKDLADYDHVVLLTSIPLVDIHEEVKVLCIGEDFEIAGVSQMKVNGAGLEITANDFYEYLNYVDEFSVITQFQGESFGKITLSFDREYPFAIKQENIYYVPYLSPTNISTFALGELLPDFFDSDYIGGIYVIIEEVFAFSDLDMLCKLADEMYLANIPFIVKVMPLYTNKDLDAFYRYTQVLRYVESRDGAIVMTPPLVNGKASKAEIAELSEVATKALEEEGIAVLPSIEGFYFVDMDYLKEVKSPSKRYESFAFDVGVLENLPTNDLQLAQMVANLNGRWYTFGSYREKFGLKSKLFIETPFDEEIAARTKIEEIPMIFVIGNNVLVIVVSFVLIAILMMIWFSRIRYKRKFIRKEE